MSSLLDKFCSLLPEGLSTKYSTAKLQTRLKNHYGDTIVIESQKGQGQSNIVFSNSISAADAICAASKLKADLKFSEVEASFVDVPDMQEDQIIHDAAKVLRGSLHAVKISKHFLALSCDNAL
jgi:fructose-specific phosphotransferase system component IIB